MSFNFQMDQRLSHNANLDDSLSLGLNIGGAGEPGLGGRERRPPALLSLLQCLLRGLGPGSDGSDLLLGNGELGGIPGGGNTGPISHGYGASFLRSLGSVGGLPGSCVPGVSSDVELGPPIVRGARDLYTSSSLLIFAAANKVSGAMGGPGGLVT